MTPDEVDALCNWSALLYLQSLLTSPPPPKDTSQVSSAALHRDAWWGLVGWACVYPVLSMWFLCSTEHGASTQHCEEAAAWVVSFRET